MKLAISIFVLLLLDKYKISTYMKVPNMLKNTIFLSFLMILMINGSLNAQRFQGSVLGGLNFAQIDGDELAGFNKLGLTGGFKIAYPLSKTNDFSIEMLYSQRGSTDAFGFGDLSRNFVDTRHLEIPVYVNIKDWWKEDDKYHKVKAHAGLNLSYLFAVESSNGAVSNDIDTYKRTAIGYVIGVDYFFTKNLGLTLRYTRDFTSTLQDSRAISYFITLRTEYAF